MARGIYVPLDANYLRDPKVRRAGPDAELLYVRGLAHAKGGGTDGMIEDFDLPVVGVGLPKLQARVDALVKVGLWEQRTGGYYISGWLNWNPSTAELADKKEQRRKGAEATNHKRYHLGPEGEPVFTCSLCRSEGLVVVA